MAANRKNETAATDNARNCREVQYRGAGREFTTCCDGCWDVIAGDTAGDSGAGVERSDIRSTLRR